MKIDTWACDICKTQKKETNHWYKGWINEEFSGRGICIYQWHVEVSNCVHLCGIECVTKWMGRELAKLTAEVEAIYIPSARHTAVAPTLEECQSRDPMGD